MTFSKTVKPATSFSKGAKPATSFSKTVKPWPTDNFVFQDGNNFVFQDGENFVFDIKFEGDWSKTAKPA